MEESPEDRQGVFAIILLHDVSEVQQRHFLPAAPHGRNMDQRFWRKWSQEELRISKNELHDWTGRDTRVSPDKCVHFL